MYENGAGDAETFFAIGARTYQVQLEWFVINRCVSGGVVGYSSPEQGDGESPDTSFVPVVIYYSAMDQIIPSAGIGYAYCSYEEDGGTSKTIPKYFPPHQCRWKVPKAFWEVPA